MLMDVVVGTNNYGRYQCAEFSITVDYGDSPWEQGRHMDFDAHPEFAKKLEEMLLGKITPVDLKYQSWPKPETILFKGETIARLHLKNIMDHWWSLDFGKTPWRQQIADLKREYVRKVLKQQVGNAENTVEVSFKYEGERQRGGSISLTPPVAKWLGEQLVKASQGDIEFQGAGIRVRKDKTILPPKKK